MPLPREVAVPGMLDEYQSFGEMLLTLSDEEWQQSTRCEGWTVADVAAHVVGQLTDVVTGKLDGLGTPEVTTREVEERRGRTPAQLVDELAEGGKLGGEIAAGFDDAAWKGPIPTGGPGTLGTGIEALWADAYIHADDIRSAIGRAPVPAGGLRGSVSHYAELLGQAGWGPATLALDGLEEFPIGNGGDRRITGDSHEFVMVATGRADPSTLGLDETVNVYRN
jgi:uncharacterized protein (TIGR03083 family)